MDFNKLSSSDKLSMLNLTTTLVSLKVIKIPDEQFDEEEIIDFLAEKAMYLLNKSNILKNQ